MNCTVVVLFSCFHAFLLMSHLSFIDSVFLFSYCLLYFALIDLHILYTDLDELFIEICYENKLYLTLKISCVNFDRFVQLGRDYFLKYVI